jgi:hypothetical protein
LCPEICRLDAPDLKQEGIKQLKRSAESVTEARAEVAAVLAAATRAIVANNKTYGETLAARPVGALGGGLLLLLLIS